eukprot:GHVU01010774.1.p1 GENE.GHVU01010774.1~~GHVU01010774.1.p1  ORF type:complete len:257 (+),score=42.00 GHVU01010774.1:188-958(+)
MCGGGTGACCCCCRAEDINDQAHQEIDDLFASWKAEGSWLSWMHRKLNIIDHFRTTIAVISTLVSCLETSWYVLKAVSKCVFMAYMTNFMTFVKATEAARTPIYCVWGLMLGGEAWLKAPAEALWWDYAWLIHARDLITETWRLRVPRVLVSSLGWAKADAQRFVLSPVEATWLWRQACFTVAAILLAVTWLCYEEPHMRDARECDELSRETEESIRRVVDKRRTVNTLAGPLKLINGEARNLMERGDAAVAHLRG